MADGVTTGQASARALTFFWLALLLAAGAYLRVHGVSDYYYSFDEMSDVMIAKGLNASEVMAFAKYETHPAYPHVLRHLQMMISDAPGFLRGASALFGLLCIPAYYLLGRQMGGRLAGCAAAFLVTFGYGSVILSQVVRNYTLLALFLALAFYCCRAFLESGKASWLCGYMAACLLGLMTHYSAFFALTCMGAAGFVELLARRKGAKLLIGWMAANAALALYFAYVYATEIHNNPYQAMFAISDKVALESPPYNTLAFREQIFIAYPLALVSFFLYSDFQNQLNFPCVILFLLAMVYLFRARERGLFYETLLALVLGGALLAANIYPYAFRIAGRHATWALPYVILPVSLFIAFCLRRFGEQMPKLRNPAVMALIACACVAGGVAADTTGAFFRDPREYQISNEDAAKMKAFLAGLAPNDVIVTGGLNMMYLLPDGLNYYDEVSHVQPGQWYFKTTDGTSPVIYTLHFPPISEGRALSLRDYAQRLNTAGEFAGKQRIWFFRTLGDTVSIAPLMDCKAAGIERFTLQGVSGPGAPLVQMAGVPREAMLNLILPPDGAYASCLP